MGRSHCIVSIATSHCCHNAATESSRIERPIRRTAFTYEVCFTETLVIYQLRVTSWAKARKVGGPVACPTPTPPYAVEHVFRIVSEKRFLAASRIFCALKRLLKQDTDDDETEQREQTHHQDCPARYRVGGKQHRPHPGNTAPSPRPHFSQQTAWFRDDGQEQPTTNCCNQSTYSRYYNSLLHSTGQNVTLPSVDCRCPKPVGRRCSTARTPTPRFRHP